MPVEMDWNRRTTAKVLLLTTLIVSTISLFVLPSPIDEYLFATVKNYVNNDPRCQTDLINARPNINNTLGWSIGEYHWRENWSIDWEQVNLFLNELAYYDEQAYWRDYYTTHPDDMQYSLFLWFQIGETEFVFLYCFYTTTHD